MEQRFPGSRRTYLKMKGSELCGGDFNAVRLKADLRGHSAVAQDLCGQKKPPQTGLPPGGRHPFPDFSDSHSGAGSYQTGRETGGHRQGRDQPSRSWGMDVDKPYQRELVRADLPAQV
jgi:hypothetical protein